MNNIDILEEKEYEELKSLLYKGQLSQYGKRKLVAIIETLISENKELKEMLKHRIEYTNKLEKDLFQNASNYVIPKSKVEKEIDKLNKKEKDLQNSISDEEREEYSDASISFDLMDIDIRRNTLQSLLGKE